MLEIKFFFFFFFNGSSTSLFKHHEHAITTQYLKLLLELTLSEQGIRTYCDNLQFK